MWDKSYVNYDIKKRKVEDIVTIAENAKKLIKIKFPYF